jgi:hypothetical protein
MRDAWGAWMRSHGEALALEAERRGRHAPISSQVAPTGDETGPLLVRGGVSEGQLRGKLLPALDVQVHEPPPGNATRARFFKSSLPSFGRLLSGLWRGGSLPRQDGRADGCGYRRRAPGVHHEIVTIHRRGSLTTPHTTTPFRCGWGWKRVGLSGLK